MLQTTMKVTALFRRGVAAELFILGVFLCLAIAPTSFASDPSSCLIQGNVTDVSGRADHIQIVAYLLRTPNGSPAFALECQTTADPEGHYSCARVSPGRYILLAIPGHGRGIALPQGDMLSSTFYPGTSDIEEAELVNVRSNTLNVFNFSLQQAPLFQISGRIDGKPKSPSLTLYRLDGMRSFKLDSGKIVKYNQQTGTFTIDEVTDGHYLITGTWQLTSASPGHTNSEVAAMGSVAVPIADGDMSDVVLKPRSLTTLDGQLEVDGERPGKSCQLQLQDIEDRQKEYRTVVSAKGDFHLTNLPSGQYRISELGIAGAYVSAVKVDGVSSASDQLNVSSDPQVQVEVNASLHSSTISGAVSDWSPGYSHVYVLARNELNGDVQIARTNASGQFSIGGLEPGEYDLYAWTSLGGIAYETRYGLKPYASNRVTVSTDDALSTGQVSLPLAEAVTY